ncbi:MAG: Eco57I restriction-modification methylase domain-containing protein [Promethearchaeota archaeon]
MHGETIFKRVDKCLRSWNKGLKANNWLKDNKIPEKIIFISIIIRFLEVLNVIESGFLNELLTNLSGQDQKAKGENTGYSAQQSAVNQFISRISKKTLDRLGLDLCSALGLKVPHEHQLHACLKENAIAPQEDGWTRLIELIKLVVFGDKGKKGIFTGPLNFDELSQSFTEISSRFHENYLANKRNTKGIYYTSTIISKFIVEKTLGTRLHHLLKRIKMAMDKGDLPGLLKIARHWKKLAVLDPACGCGSFLIQALKCLKNYYEKLKGLILDPKIELFKQADINELNEDDRKIFNWVLRLADPDFLLKNALMHIHGIDIDYIAIHICKINLIIEIIKYGIENKANICLFSQMLEINLMHANTLVGFSKEKTIKTLMNQFPEIIRKIVKTRNKIVESAIIRKEAIEYILRERKTINAYFNKDFKAYINENKLIRSMLKIPFFHFPVAYPWIFFDSDNEQLILNDKGFDCIIGNPPYVNYKKYLNTIDRKFLEANYQIFNGQADLSYYFFEIHETLLAPGGTSGQITQRYFIEAAHAMKLRKLLSKQKILYIIDFNEINVFPNLGVHTVIFIFQDIKKHDEKLNQHEIKFIRVPDGCQDLDQAMNIVNYAFKNNVMIKKLPQQELNEKPWLLIDKREKQIKAKFDKHPKLHQLGTCLGGAETGRDDVFINNIIKENNKFFGITKQKERIPLETKFLHPWIKNSDIEKFKHAPSKTCIFIPPNMNERELKTQAPGIYKYLQSFKYELENRDNGKINVPWFVWRRPNNVKNLNVSPKIICPYKAKIPKFSIDFQKCYCSYDVTIFVPNQKCPDIYYVNAILNSLPIEWYFKTYAKKMGKIYEFYSAPVSQIVIPEPVKPICDEIAKLSRKLIELKNTSKNNAITNKKQFDEDHEKINKIENQIQDKINQYVFQLLDLNDQEISLIKQKMLKNKFSFNSFF